MMETFEQMLARDLSFYQWEFLADHFQGPRPILPNEQRTRIALANHKLIKVNQCYKPTHTILTERGHGVMCAAMGLMADVLIKGGYEAAKPAEKNYAYGQIVATESRESDGELSAHVEYRS